MLTKDEYNTLLPERDIILRFEFEGTYRGNLMTQMDLIIQRIYHRPTCFSCSGSKANMINDIIALIKNYEENNTTN